MAYSINPNLVKARAIALKMHIVDGLPLSVVARRCGIHRTTLWRWVKKWHKLNQNISEDCLNRPGRFKLKKVQLNTIYYRWTIPTKSSAPLTHPLAISELVVGQVLVIRNELKRCAEVVWHHLAYILNIHISLSSVKRIFRRHHIYDRKTDRKRPYHKSLPRPLISAPGDLVQIDTIHLINPLTMKRLYIYTVIDLYTRMAYASVHTVIRPGLAARATLIAQTSFGFNFSIVQSDNGAEFSSYFEKRLHSKGIKTRHSRLHRPNDNAHIERFNRTIQEECTGRYWSRSVPLPRLQEKIDNYLDYYNTKRVHLGIQLRTPAEMLQR
ncbi:MAG: integrase core domain-containing protein [Candidatus Saccharibacteria bacterium]